ncbi:hypothetical protein FisN_32Lh076 [Fistulifera solaris]|jgi:hypothetical protein|uniref:Uncharacterized protein n=1 Tax=Fistulifera solaris TaxID=1519565 RepID=A0A1Z5JGL6_FISSO|nr:hypothetical protein FisN_32Lh076 [Fistulifera solaris]|eukprot:GAX12901.1 hypothetical protein FisN_32Lh076 [Fistulifera solaris]
MSLVNISEEDRLSDFSERQLTVEIQDLQDLSIILETAGEATECLLWLPQREAFLSNVSQFGSSVHIPGYRCPTMEIEWSDEGSERFSYWHVHAMTVTLERQIVAHLVTLPDANGFTSLSVTSMLEDDQKNLFPCSPDQIKKTFHYNIDRELHIQDFALDESQAVALVEPELPLRIKLSSCQFISKDASMAGHSAFNQALQRRSSPLHSLSFGQNLPFPQSQFRQRQLIKFWRIAASLKVVETLCLEDLDVTKENGFGELSSVPLKRLVLSDCTFGLEGTGIEIIAELIHCGCLSEGLVCDGLECELGPSWYIFGCAIANCQLSELRLENVGSKEAALLTMGVFEMVGRNTKLQHLSVGDYFNFSPDVFTWLMAALSKHPSLQVFQVDNVHEGIPQDLPATALKSLAEMMQLNRNIDVDVQLSRYKRKLDETSSIERLQKFNRFSRQVGKLAKLEDLNDRLTLVGTSAVETGSDFQKLSLLIAGHVDILVPSFRDAVYGEEEASSRKRARLG